jgi:hypothetical protein
MGLHGGSVIGLPEARWFAVTAAVDKQPSSARTLRDGFAVSGGRRKVLGMDIGDPRLRRC